MDALEKYLIKCAADNLSRETIRDKRRHLTVFLECAPKSLELLDLDELYQVINKALTITKHDSVKKKMTKDLRAFFQYLNESGKSKIIYTAIKNYKYSSKIRPRMLEDEYVTLINKCKELVESAPPRANQKFKGKNVYKLWLCALQVLYSSGVRVNELVTIKMEDVNIKERYFAMLGKGKKWRQCWFEADIDEYVEEFQPTDKLFPVTTKCIERAFQRLCKLCGIRDLSPHTCRHAFCSDLIESGVDALTTCSLSGHAKVQTLYEHYWHPSKLKENWRKRKLPNI